MLRSAILVRSIVRTAVMASRPFEVTWRRVLGTFLSSPWAQRSLSFGPTAAERRLVGAEAVERTNPPAPILARLLKGTRAYRKLSPVPMRATAQAAR